MRTLEDKVIIITGAKGGLGSFVTQACLDAGAKVAGVSRSIQNADFPHPAFCAVPAELSSSEAARSVAGRVADQFGRIDGLVHLLGGFSYGATVAETEDQALEQMLDLNLRSAFWMMKAALPHLRLNSGGKIVAIGSRAATEGNALAGVYSASKAALIALIRAVAAENADRCVSANVVLPTTMDTAANRKAMPGADFSRWVQPAQVASLIVALIGDSISQVNGAVIPVYGRDV